MSTLGDEDVRRFHVPVDDALAVSGIECISNLNGQREQRLQFHRSLANHVLQRHAIHVLHGDK